MAYTLGKKVNCMWSISRLKEEHDLWSKEITQTLLSFEPLVNLTINEIYIKFAEFSGFKLLKTNRDMMHEGLIQKHCVASYISQVNSGNCAIYSVNDFTLQLSVNTYEKRKIIINQFKGQYNNPAPIDLINLVKEKLDEFNDYKLNKIENVREEMKLSEVF